MTILSHLPALDAFFNLMSAACLAAGYFFIRRKNIRAHRRCMTLALAASALFLVSYLVHHELVGIVRYQGRGWLRGVYFAVLASHTILAVVIVPLVLCTLTWALQGRWDAHRRWARWTLPLWFYVSVTGVVIYEMLY